jgi:acetyl-CoA synthetase
MTPTNPSPQEPIEVLLEENRSYPPPPSFARDAVVSDPEIYREAAADRDRLWAAEAERLEWIAPWRKVCTGSAPDFRWFEGGKLNVAVNCVDRHARGAHRTKAALVWEGEPGDRRTLTYWDLYRDVNRFGNALRSLGIRKGDRVAIYMPLIPEAVIAMLACARIGAVHTVVFGGFSADALRDRINDAQAKLLVTADGGYRRGGLLPLKHDADHALQGCPSIQHVVIVKRGDFPLRVKEGRDHWYHRLMQEAAAWCEPEPMEAEDLFFILYTSGTTGKPKGIVHTTGGYLTGVASTTRWVFDLKESDIYWCTADIGWITGHSYMVYGPLANGATVVLYEGAPDWPDRDRFWQIVEDHGVSVFYTAPTAIRAFMKWGSSWPEKHDLSSLRLLGTVGEPINPEAWVWYHKTIGGGRCPVVDTWWQTETGMILISPLPGLTTLKPGSCTHALPGVEVDILDEMGDRVEVGGGYLAIRGPWPAMTRGIYGDPERYRATYWSKWPGIYFPGDGAKRDHDGYLWVLGRVDDVMNVAGHRIGTMEVESVLVEHPAVAEAAVVGRPHDLKGTAIAAFVSLRQGVSQDGNLAQQLKEFVANRIGALARPEDIIFSADLPKTRSGKIMRRLLRDIAEGKALGDTTTLADPAVVEALKRHYEED